MKRKFVQIAVTSPHEGPDNTWYPALYALDDEGRVWVAFNPRPRDTTWRELPPPPPDDEAATSEAAGGT
jgi:hypothetical protein